MWGVFLWKEFRNAPKGTNGLIASMFVFFVVGLGLIIYAVTAEQSPFFQVKSYPT
jgi:glucose uptake protein